MLDQFYTKGNIAELCYDILLKNIPLTIFDIILEPSAGTGSFLKLLPIEKRIGIDLDPKSEEIQKLDFFDYKFDNNKKYLVIGNPPFGKNSSLAKKFFNRCAEFVEVIAFIVPKTFNKLSTQNQLSLNFILKESIDLPLNSFIFENKEYSVPTCFQIWIKGKRQKIILPIAHKDFEFSSKNKADFSLRRVGALAGKVNLNLNFAESSNYFIYSENKNLYEKFSKLEKLFMESAKNTAGNPSLSKTEIVEIYSNNNE